MNTVLQGSVLRALHFIMFINNIPEGVPSLIKMFVDDTKISRKVHTEKDIFSRVTLTCYADRVQSSKFHSTCGYVSILLDKKQNK